MIFRGKNPKLAQKRDEIVAEQNKGRSKIRKMSVELIEKEIKEELNVGLENKLNELALELSKTEENNGEMSPIKIKNLITSKTLKYSVRMTEPEIRIAFEYYKKMLEMINEKQMYLPTKKNFCSFLGISSATYDNMRRSNDTDTQEIMQIIDDYITDSMLTASQNGKIKEISTIYRTKSEHGMVEAVAPIVVEHREEANIDKIIKQIEMINKGKSLKTIEIDKKDYTKEEK